MKITYQQSGGYAGITKRYEADTATMDPTDGEALQALVEQAALQGSMTVLSNEARDVVLHDIRIEQAGKTDQLVVDDLTAPAALQPLLGFLKKRARAAGRH